MYEGALGAQGISTSWVEMPEILASITRENGTSLLEEASVNPYAVRVRAEEYSLVPGIHRIDSGVLVIIASDIYGPFAPIIAHTLSVVGAHQPNSPQSLRLANDKWVTHVMFRDAGLPVPHARLANSMEEVRSAARELGFPLVVKELEGTQGLGVRLARDEDELIRDAVELEIERQPLLIEHYIECGAVDKRIVTMNHHMLAAMERHAKSGDFRANIALGGVGETTEVSEFELSIVQKATDLIGLRLVGMDLGTVKEVLPGREYLPVGSPFLIEPNPMPGLSGLRDATHIDAARVIVSELISDLEAVERPVA